MPRVRVACVQVVPDMRALHGGLNRRFWMTCKTTGWNAHGKWNGTSSEIAKGST